MYVYWQSVKEYKGCDRTQPVNEHIQHVIFPKCHLSAGQHLSGHGALWSSALQRPLTHQFFFSAAADSLHSHTVH